MRILRKSCSNYATKSTTTISTIFRVLFYISTYRVHYLLTLLVITISNIPGASIFTIHYLISQPTGFFSLSVIYIISFSLIVVYCSSFPGVSIFMPTYMHGQSMSYLLHCVIWYLNTIMCGPPYIILYAVSSFNP